MVKKYMAVGALMLLVAALSGCGGGGEDGASSSGSSSAVQAPISTPTTTAKPAGLSNAELVEVGEKAFGTCAGCHGSDATGVSGLGKNLVRSDFITDISDPDLAIIIKTGRSASDAANTTGIDMPPKGGNPALNDEQIAGLVAYIRSLQ